MDTFLLHNRPMAGEFFTFGAFTFDAAHGTLTRAGAPVAVSSRGLALLKALLHAGGEIIPKHALMDAAWPNASIEESNLTVQIAALRKSLGDDGEQWIGTIPRIGYRFAGRIRAGAGFSASVPPVSPPSAAADLAIAVLPFTNVSSDPEQDYFATGLAEDLITDLSKVPGLVVIARNSSFAYSGKPTDVRAVARDLGVRYVVEGSVRRAADRVRINAELIDASDNSHVWADRFNGDLGDVFKLQDEVVGWIVAALVGALPQTNTARKRATNLEAYDLFVRGRVLVGQMSYDNKEARPFLQKSIELEPGFSDAHAWLAISHHFAWTYWAEPMEPHRVLSFREARHAVTLDEESATAHAILGDVLLFEHKLDEGAAELDTALRLNPNNADALVFYGAFHFLEGSVEEGIEKVRQALRLNPHPPGWYYWMLGFGQYEGRQYEEAILTLRQGTALRTGARRILAASLAQLGRLDEAAAEGRAFLADNPHFSTDYWAWSQPFRREADRQHFVDGYLKAGLPR